MSKLAWRWIIIAAIGNWTLFALFLFLRHRGITNWPLVAVYAPLWFPTALGIMTSLFILAHDAFHWNIIPRPSQKPEEKSSATDEL